MTRAGRVRGCWAVALCARSQGAAGVAVALPGPHAMLDEPELAREWAEWGWQEALQVHLLKKAKKRLCLALCTDPETNSGFGGR
jgi:hypothetical protein